MITDFRKILFPTDFSDCADQALEHCLGLARAHSAAVTLLHVQVMLDNTPVETDRQELEALLDRFQGRGARRLEQWAVGRAGSLRVDTAIVRGFSPSEEIINTLRGGEYDLLVMGTNGRGWMGRMLLGSVAAQVIRLSPVPVYTVREGLATPWLSPENSRLVVSVDFSAGSQLALAMAGGLASSNFAVMDVVHVMEKPDYPVFYPEARVSALEARLEQNCLQKMREEVAAHCPPGLRVEFHVLEGRPHAEIVGYAEESGAGLVVIAGRGLGDGGPHFLGSTVEKVVASCGTAVLTVVVPQRSTTGH
jgi:nucleotide-binding universal stress UspA family protein